MNKELKNKQKWPGVRRLRHKAQVKLIVELHILF